MRILFAGTPNVALPTLEWILSSDHELVGVLTRPAAAQGRSSELIDSPVATFAKTHLIPIHTSLDSPETKEAIKSADLVVVIAFGKLIPKEFLQMPKFGWINVHFSILPKFRGAAPVQRAIWSGEKSTGISIFQLDPGMDTGPIYDQKSTPILPTESAGECLARLSQIVPELLIQTLNKIQKLAQPIPQNEEGATLAPKIDKSELRINWSDSGRQIQNKIRALNPTPRARTTFRENEIYIFEVAVSDNKSTQPPGTIFAVNQHLYVATEELDIEIIKVQSSGKKVMSGSEWCRGVQMKENPLENRYV